MSMLEGGIVGGIDGGCGGDCCGNVGGCGEEGGGRLYVGVVRELCVWAKLCRGDVSKTVFPRTPMCWVECEYQNAQCEPFDPNTSHDPVSTQSWLTEPRSRERSLQ